MHPLRLFTILFAVSWLSYLFGHLTILRFVTFQKCQGNVGFKYLDNYRLFHVRKKNLIRIHCIVQGYDSDSELDYSEPETENDSGNFVLFNTMYIYVLENMCE